MNSKLPEAFHPRIGLTDIALSDESPHAKLPDDSRLQPIDASVEAQLRAMLQATTFDSMILDAVRPQAFDRNILAPSRFHILRDEITARLTALQRTAASPAEAAELLAAVNLLHARSSEHELGEALRYALLKG